MLKLTVEIYAINFAALDQLLCEVAGRVVEDQAVFGTGGGGLGASYQFKVEVGGAEMPKVTLFRQGWSGEVDLPFNVGPMFGNRTLLNVNGDLLVKHAQASREGELILLVRPVIEIAGQLEGEAAVEAEKKHAFSRGAGWLDKRDCPLQVVWEGGEQDA